LLTDGLANRGIEDLEELATHSRELYRRGIATSCFGVGHDYNEHLLEAMANAGGGTFHYLETVNAIPLEFERDFNELVNVSLRDTELSLVLPTEVKAKVSAGYLSEVKDNKLSIALGSLYSGKEMKVYITLNLPRRDHDEPVILTATVRGKGEGDYLCEDTKFLNFSVVSADEESARPRIMT
jgi:Ca-activated chloride channel family protein